jgi:hypothetical protein
MNTYTDIVVIKGSWKGGQHGSYPKILSVSLDSERPFGVSEGWGHGLGGSSFTLKDLVEKKFIEIFNREESKAVYLGVITAYSLGVDQKQLASQLIKESSHYS